MYNKLESQLQIIKSALDRANGMFKLEESATILQAYVTVVNAIMSVEEEGNPQKNPSEGFSSITGSKITKEDRK